MPEFRTDLIPPGVLKTIQLRERHGKRKFSWLELDEILVELVRVAERLMGSDSGGRKKDFVVKTLNDLIDLPLLTESQEAFIFNLLVELAVARAKGW